MGEISKSGGVDVMTFDATATDREGFARQEKAYAAGRIPGGFFRREGRPAEHGKWELKEFRASQGRKNHSAVNPAPEKGMEKTDQAERRSCLAER